MENSQARKIINHEIKNKKNKVLKLRSPGGGVFVVCKRMKRKKKKTVPSQTENKNKIIEKFPLQYGKRKTRNDHFIWKRQCE